MLNLRFLKTAVKITVTKSKSSNDKFPTFIDSIPTCDGSLLLENAKKP